MAPAWKYRSIYNESIHTKHLGLHKSWEILSAWVPSRCEAPGSKAKFGSLTQASSPMQWLAPNAGSVQQRPSRLPFHHHLPPPEPGHESFQGWKCQTKIPGPPPSWTDPSMPDLHITCRLTAAMGRHFGPALNIVVSLLVHCPLWAQAEWTASSTLFSIRSR